jgi:hypothetical protein
MPRRDPSVEDAPNEQGTRTVSYTEHLGAGIIFHAMCLFDAANPVEGQDAEAVVRRHADGTKAMAVRTGAPVEIASARLGRCPGYDGFRAGPDGAEVRTRFIRARDRAFVLVFTGPGRPASPGLWQTYVGSLHSDLCDP